IGSLLAALLRAISWILLSALIASNAIANAVGKRSEFDADRRVVEMGYGRELARALRRVLASERATRPRSWRDRLRTSHPAPRTRVARIEALVRTRAAARAGAR